MAQDVAALAKGFFEELWNRRDATALDRFAEPASQAHQAHGGTATTAEFREQVHAPFLAAFPDLRLDVESVVAQGDDAVLRWRATGTHTGDGLGIPASGRPIDIRGITWFTFKNGKITEGWDRWDIGGLMQRLSAAE